MASVQQHAVMVLAEGGLRKAMSFPVMARALETQPMRVEAFDREQVRFFSFSERLLTVIVALRQRHVLTRICLITREPGLFNTAERGLCLSVQ